ncbi:hypothetical protein V1477_020205 [Vespula maculifrons]|uniref:Uncharacterized protein n=1 Tax=Vespula maculifrons TaxID=7453 RepID=A0ABD2AP20_VESMC
MENSNLKTTERTHASDHNAITSERKKFCIINKKLLTIKKISVQKRKALFEDIRAFDDNIKQYS